MAVVRFNDGKEPRKITAEEGAELWAVLNGEIEGTPEQQRYCETVEKLYLNWQNAPDSYIRARFELIAPMAMGHWMRTKEGEYTRPEPSDQHGRDFGKKWGLLANGYITPLGRKYAGK